MENTVFTLGNLQGKTSWNVSNLTSNRNNRGKVLVVFSLTVNSLHSSPVGGHNATTSWFIKQQLKLNEEVKLEEVVYLLRCHINLLFTV